MKQSKQIGRQQRGRRTVASARKIESNGGNRIDSVCFESRFGEQYRLLQMVMLQRHLLRSIWDAFVRQADSDCGHGCGGGGGGMRKRERKRGWPGAQVCECASAQTQLLISLS